MLKEIKISNDTLFDTDKANTVVADLSLYNIKDSLENQTSFLLTNDSLGIDNNKFEIISKQLVLKEDVDYLSQQTYTIHITAINNFGCQKNELFTIHIKNTNVPPTDIQPNPAYIRENSAINTKVTDLEAIDQSPNDEHTFTLTSDTINFPDNTNFSISGVSLLSATSFNYENQKKYTLQIKVSDKLNNDYIDTFTVIIKDVIEFDDLKAPNYLSPNGDCINDNFIIPNIDLFKTYYLYIYNDNGNEVFRQEEPYQNDWSGTANSGETLPTGTYYYYFLNADNPSKHFKGALFIEQEKKY